MTKKGGDNNKNNKNNISSISDPILTKLLMEGFWDKTTTTFLGCDSIVQSKGSPTHSNCQHHSEPVGLLETTYQIKSDSVNLLNI